MHKLIRVFRKSPPLSFSIRAAVPEDAEAVMRLRKAVDKGRGNRNPPLDPYGGNYPTLDQQRSEIEEAIRQSVFLVAVAGNDVIGSANCWSFKDTSGEYVLQFIVRVDCRNQGVGTALVSEAVTWAKTSNNVTRLTCLFSKSHKSAKHILEKFGFSVVKQGLMPFMQAEYFHAVDMSLSL